MLVDPKSPKKDSQVVSLSYAFWDLHVQKLLVERWRNWPLVDKTIR